MEVNKDPGKFQKEGIHPELEDKRDRMFIDIVTTGKNAWAPSSGVLPHGSGEASNKDVILVEGIDDSEGGPNCSLDKTTPNARGVIIQATQPTQNKKKNKRVAKEHSIQETQGKKVQGDKEGKVCGATKLSQQIDSTESKSPATSKSEYICDYSIAKVIEELDNMPEELEPASDLYFLAIKLFKDKDYREMFTAIKKSDLRLIWLKMWQARNAQK